MNFDNLITWITGLVLAAAISGNLDSLQKEIWIAKLKLIRASQTRNWNSPRFFPSRSFTNSEESSDSLVTNKKGETEKHLKQQLSKEVLYEK